MYLTPGFGVKGLLRCLAAAAPADDIGMQTMTTVLNFTVWQKHNLLDYYVCLRLQASLEVLNHVAYGTDDPIIVPY